MRILFSSIAFILISQATFGQSKVDTYHKKAKVYFKDHRILKVNALNINENDISYLLPLTNEKKQQSKHDISLIKAPRGNHLVVGSLFGLATGGLTALLIDLDPDPLLPQDEKDLGFYLSWAGGGALVAGLIGLLVPKWKSVQFEQESLGANISLKVDGVATSSMTGIKITMSL